MHQGRGAPLQHPRPNLDSQEMRPSLREQNPKDARYGDGQYLTDIAPGTRTLGQLSAAFLRVPWAGQKFTHFLEIDVNRTRCHNKEAPASSLFRTADRWISQEESSAQEGTSA